MGFSIGKILKTNATRATMRQVPCKAQIYWTFGVALILEGNATECDTWIRAEN